MATLLNGSDTNRLVEVLAGSTALSDSNGVAGALPLSLNAVLSDDLSTTATDQAASNAGIQTLDAVPLDTVTAVVDDALGNDTGSLTNLLGIGDVLNLGTESQLDLAGPDGAVQPVFDATNILVKDFHAEIEGLSHETGTSDLLHAVTNLGETVGLGNTGVVPPAVDDGHTNLVTDVVNLPGTLLTGGLDDVIAQIGGDLGDTVGATIDLVGAVINGNDPLNPVPEIIDGLANSLQTLPLLNINGGTSAGDGGLLGGGGLGGGLLNGVVGDLTHSSSGHLIDIDAGPQDTSGLGLDVLAAPGTDATHTASVNVIDVGPNGPHLLDLGVLTGAGIISIPGLGGAGTDGLAGGLPCLDGVAGGLLGGDIASGNTTSVPVTAPLELTALNDLLSAPVTADHGILDLHGAHII